MSKQNVDWWDSETSKKLQVSSNKRGLVPNQRYNQDSSESKTRAVASKKQKQKRGRGVQENTTFSTPSQEVLLNLQCTTPPVEDAVIAAGSRSFTPAADSITAPKSLEVPLPPTAALAGVAPRLSGKSFAMSHSLDAPGISVPALQPVHDPPPKGAPTMDSCAAADPVHPALPPLCIAISSSIDVAVAGYDPSVAGVDVCDVSETRKSADPPPPGPNVNKNSS